MGRHWITLFIDKTAMVMVGPKLEINYQILLTDHSANTSLSKNVRCGYDSSLTALLFLNVC